MSYVIENYEVINGSKMESRLKNKSVPNIDYIDSLQKRATRLWSFIHKEELIVLINYKIPKEKHIPWKNDPEYYEKLKSRGRILQKK